MRSTHPLSSSPAPTSSFVYNNPTNNYSSLHDNTNGLLGGQEQVTTIFVVGFPEDMQEREFQNMFMFSPGFEASSLQWYSKDQDDDSATINTNTTTNSNTSAPLNGKKQMIGFAKFRTRLEALEAVEVISGKKVDQDKGLVLKAEMAKKNLHVKRKSIIPPTDTTSSLLESVSINNKNMVPGYSDEPFNFSPLPSDLFSPMIDYKSDPFTLVHQQQQSYNNNNNNNNNNNLFNDNINLFGFRSYSIDGRANNNNNGLGFAPRASISSNTSFTNRMSLKQQQQQQHQHNKINTRSGHEDNSLDPFNYMSKSSPVPADHIGSYFSDDLSFGSLSINDSFGTSLGGLRTDYSSLGSPTSPPQRSNSLMMMPSRPLMPVNESSNNLNNISSTSGNGFMNNMMTMMMMTASRNNTNNNTNNTNNNNLADQNPPCNTLYVGNLPPANTVEDELRQLFSKCAGYKRMYFRTKSQGPMCFVEFDDIMYATQCMTDLQGHCLSNSVKGGIRLSFSKNPLFIKPQNSNSNKVVDQEQQAYPRGDFGFDPSF
ncbi:hypothetical protein BC941DRAFT_455765 [Chlamydoabsidia padenii]|nr:hypothetical protein BC941DRAFT_455765 [Chlamydoabsidia padenii]